MSVGFKSIIDWDDLSIRNSLPASTNYRSNAVAGKSSSKDCDYGIDGNISNNLGAYLRAGLV